MHMANAHSNAAGLTMRTWNTNQV